MDSSSNLPRPFGAYLLLHRVGEGGMGEVFLASRGHVAGIEKLTVVKTLRTQYAADQDYVTRFIDEARVVVQLNHRNICQVYDVGRVADTYFLAMEYVDGRDVGEIRKRAAAQKLVISESLSLQIVGEVLEALEYAHRHRDPITQEPLQLVHRDVSPKNVMVSVEGEVKLIDFGLAESRLKESTTEPDVVMGKIAYMSPEQARREPVDSGADVYAAGVLLYELLAGERYYEGLSVEQIWLCVGLGTHKPKKLDSFGADVGALLRKALAPERVNRYAGCDAFLDDLRKVQATKPRSGSRELRELMATLFGADRRELHQLLAELRRLADIVDETNIDPLGPTETIVIARRDSSSTGSVSAVPKTDSGPKADSGPSAVPKSDVFAPIAAPRSDAFSRPVITEIVEHVRLPADNPRRSARAAAAALVVVVCAALGYFGWTRLQQRNHRHAPPLVGALLLRADAGAAATNANANVDVTDAGALVAPRADAGSAVAFTRVDAGAGAGVDVERDAGVVRGVDAGVVRDLELPVEPVADKTERVRVRPKAAPKKVPPPPATGVADRREWLKKHCASLKCTATVAKVDASNVPVQALLDLKRDVDACVETCSKDAPR